MWSVIPDIARSTSFGRPREGKLAEFAQESVAASVTTWEPGAGPAKSLCKAYSVEIRLSAEFLTPFVPSTSTAGLTALSRLRSAGGADESAQEVC